MEKACRGNDRKEAEIMLEPEYFNDKADRMLELYRELEDFILQDISMRLLKSQSMSATADRMIWKLQQMGESRAEIMKKLSKITGLSRKELKALLQDAVLTSWKDDLSTFNKIGINIASPLENPLVMAVMDAEYRKSQGELENLTRTTMNQANKDLIQMLDAAELRVASGVQSYSGAVCDILDNYAGKGVTIEYPTGTKRTLEAAVRMCVTTSMNQTSAEITNRYIVENGIEYVRVSAHLGARVQRPGQPELAGHDNWQGHVFKRHGSEPGYPNLAEATGYDIAEDGAGINVNMLGLHGYGCRHSHAAWDKRLRNDYFDKDGNPRIDAEENRKEYERQQKQRAMERAIRKTKRELLVKQSEIKMVAETDVKEMLQQQYDGLSYKLRTQNEKYRQFCTENKMKMQYDRLKVAGFKRQQAAQANGRATAFQNWQEKQAETKIPMEKTKDVGYTKRTKEEFEQIAKQIKGEITEYSDRPSKWSGNINVTDTLLNGEAFGIKEWSCDISLIDTADDGVIWHEMLHSCSASYYDHHVYQANQAIEEASVEWLKQQICKAQQITNIYSYEEQTIVLKALNERFSYGTDMEFARELFKIPLPNRYQWLEDKVDNSLRSENASFADYNDVMFFLSRLRGAIE